MGRPKTEPSESKKQKSLVPYNASQRLQEQNKQAQPEPQQDQKQQQQDQQQQPAQQQPAQQQQTSSQQEESQQQQASPSKKGGHKQGQTIQFKPRARYEPNIMDKTGGEDTFRFTHLPQDQASTSQYKEQVRVQFADPKEEKREEKHFMDKKISDDQELPPKSVKFGNQAPAQSKVQVLQVDLDKVQVQLKKLKEEQELKDTILESLQQQIDTQDTALKKQEELQQDRLAIFKSQIQEMYFELQKKLLQQSQTHMGDIVQQKDKFEKGIAFRIQSYDSTHQNNYKQNRADISGLNQKVQKTEGDIYYLRSLARQKADNDTLQEFMRKMQMELEKFSIQGISTGGQSSKKDKKTQDSTPSGDKTPKHKEHKESKDMSHHDMEDLINRNEFRALIQKEVQRALQKENFELNKQNRNTDHAAQMERLQSSHGKQEIQPVYMTQAQLAQIHDHNSGRKRLEALIAQQKYQERMKQQSSPDQRQVQSERSSRALKSKNHMIALHSNRNRKDGDQWKDDTEGLARKEESFLRPSNSIKHETNQNEQQQDPSTQLEQYTVVKSITPNRLMSPKDKQKKPIFM